MKIENLKLKNFTVFEDVSLDFCSGINVLVGANGTGKSHVLKALYGVQKSWDTTVLNHTNAATHAVARCLAILNKLNAVFAGNEGNSSLVRRHSDNESLAIEVTSDVWRGASRVRFTFEKNGNVKSLIMPRLRTPTPCLFLPPREFLSAYEGFIAAYTNRELSFDGTYFDLCVALSASPLKGEAAKWGRDVSL